MFRLHRKLVPALLLVLGLGTAASADPDPPVRPSAEAYYRVTQKLLGEIRSNLPVITKTASNAAKLYVDDPNIGIGTDGDTAFCEELVGRAGGIMAIGYGWPMQKIAKGWKGQILYCLIDSAAGQAKQTSSDVARIAKYQAAGCHVTLFGTKELIDAATAVGAKVDEVVVIPTAEHGGAFGVNGKWLVPTYQLSAMATGTAWVGEFVAACTRLGRTPVMFQSVMVVPTGRERIKRYTLPAFTTGSFQKFHEDSTNPPDPIKAGPVKEGQLGTQYLDRVVEALQGIHDKEMGPIELAGKRCAQTLESKHRLFWISEGHGTNSVTNVSHSTGVFDPNIKNIAKGDLVVDLGYDRIPNDVENNHFADKSVRETGASAVWICTTDYHKDLVTPVGDEILIDTHWTIGDAVVDLPGYDVRILPTSGILTTTVYMMIQAQMLGEAR